MSNKDSLRKRAHVERATLYERHGSIGEVLAKNFSAEVDCGEGSCVAGYVPIRSEVDPRSILCRLSDEGWDCALPTISEGREDIIFRNWQIGDELTIGPYGIPEPGRSQPEVSPDLLLVPMLAYDEFGHRLGYGAGYYDRALARLRGQGDVVVVGLAYAGCKIDPIAADFHDEMMDLVVTEEGVFQPKQAAV